MPSGKQAENSPQKSAKQETIGKIYSRELWAIPLGDNGHTSGFAVVTCIRDARVINDDDGQVALFPRADFRFALRRVSSVSVYLSVWLGLLVGVGSNASPVASTACNKQFF